ncbi:phosphoheptose isomerase [Clostridium beijerinckii]|uniref:SIS domain-containing protein n=1 Tax=Clostridium beijerinckii TaxID=1520 RepID=A0AB74VIL5_CLOBE|nr:SIS domain-containing protein [Clostridium beijerinckii]NRZ25591.1 D-sedoheptulose 7-phosphate isomerase [Clostridium beijerinckii]NYB98106.1 D-sedoheptulose 7-phosphate isomerase [Clostridium beijerinckii]OOM23278.1 phosphoheptose isomerase [Clostridium beijerinckii]QUN36346.1 SIS domain-containing protein [Clostridium beijerinckii]SQB12946.1 sugar isomerase (SIS) [Clostridium beijerinckii]
MGTLDDRLTGHIKLLIKRYPVLEIIKAEIIEAYCALEELYKNGGKLLIAGNGGSAADADHIVGELMKGFKKKRKISDEFSKKLIDIDDVMGKKLAEKLQDGLPAIALNNHAALATAYLNDVDGILCFAQQVNGYGKKGDVFLGISTSGNSENVYYAAITARAKGMKVIGLTGKDGGKLKSISDVLITVPEYETYMIQELHLPVYHCLCLMLEEKFFE